MGRRGIRRDRLSNGSPASWRGFWRVWPTLSLPRTSVRGALLLLLFLFVVLLPSCGEEPRNVSLWHSYRGDEEAALKEVAHRFEVAHPGTHVELLGLPFDAYQAKLKAAIPHGHGPDLFIDAHERVQPYARDGFVAEVSLESQHYDAAALSAVTQDGKLLAIPLSEKCLALYVRNSVPDSATHTLEDLLALPAPAGGYPLAYDASGAFYHQPILSAFGGAYVDGAKYTFDSAEGEASVRWVQDTLVAKGRLPKEPSSGVATELFVSGKANALIEGPWQLATLPKDLGYHVVPLPTLGGAPMRPFVAVESAFLTPRGKTNADALALLQFLGSREAAVVLATIGHQVVARKDAWDDPDVKAERTLDAFHRAADAGVLMPATEAMNTAWVPSSDALKRAVSGQDAHASLAEAHRRWDEANAPPPPRKSPGALYFALGFLTLLGALALVRRARDPKFRREVKRSVPAYRYVTHAAVAVVLLVVVPLAAGALTSFYSGTRQNPQYVGLANYLAILGPHDGSLFGHGSFYVTLAVTVLWTVTNVVLHLVLGLSLGLLLSRPLLKLRTVYRVLLVLPWAVPSYVTALAWKGMFHGQFGAINALLVALGCEPVSWFSKFSTAFAANVATNVWLGFPFMMVVTLGALTSIPKDVLEAAEVDGATRWQRFHLVTLPLLKPSLLPAVILGAVWTFNMFNVVFLVSGGEPDGKTDILVSDAYRWAFTRDTQYGYGAAYAVLIFLLLFVTSRVTAKKGEA